MVFRISVFGRHLCTARHQQVEGEGRSFLCARSSRRCSRYFIADKIWWHCLSCGVRWECKYRVPFRLLVKQECVSGTKPLSAFQHPSLESGGREDHSRIPTGTHVKIWRGACVYFLFLQLVFSFVC